MPLRGKFSAEYIYDLQAVKFFDGEQNPAIDIDIATYERELLLIQRISYYNLFRWAVFNEKRR